MPDDRPNILLITTDQQRFDTLQCEGNRAIWTPHLDWLCDGGIRFANAYSDCPVCLPARTTIMTGRHAWRHRVMSNRWVPGACEPSSSLAGTLSAAGWQTRLIGKQHHGPSPRHLMGFMAQDERGHYFQERSRQGADGWRHGLGGNENAPGIDEAPGDQTLTRWCVDRTRDFIARRDPSAPFFAWLSFNEPHPPYAPTRSMWSLYAGKPMPPRVTGDWSASAAAVPPAFQAVTRELSQTQRLDDAQIAELRRAYYALISQVDYQLGELFGFLHEQRLLETTWIIFTSDHGEMLGDHWMGGKCVPFEGSARVPLIVRPPHGMRDHRRPWRGRRSDALACLADIMPTILAAAGAPARPDADGIDLMAAWRGEARRDRLFGTCSYLHYVRDGRWKYCRETLSGAELLFDLVADPLETADAIRAGTAPAELSRLRRDMDEHIARNDLRQAAADDPAVASDASSLPENTCPGFTSELGRWR